MRPEQRLTSRAQDRGNPVQFSNRHSCLPSFHIRYSTEVYFTDGPVQDQLDWLTNDLKEANKPENRAKRPWIIAFGHRPMYCSNIDHDDCSTLHSVVRKG